MRIAVVCAVLLCAASAAAGEGPPPEAVRTAIARGLEFLAADALAWKAEHNCVSCHHAGLVVWALHAGRSRGHAINEPVATELTTWIAQSGSGKTGVPRPPGIPKALNTKAVFHALALNTVPQQDESTRQGLANMLQTIREDQLDDGSWAAWPETRPPLFGGSNDSMTGLATLGLLPSAARGDPLAKAALDRAVRWFEQTPTDGDPQSLALRLILWRRIGKPAEEYAALVRKIQERQRPNGGWSQSAEMTPDAWATGQALFALAEAGLKPTDPAIARGQAFLINTQQDNGAWPMTSRPTKPGGAGSNSLIPITGAGSAWGVLGLVHSQ